MKIIKRIKGLTLLLLTVAMGVQAQSGNHVFTNSEAANFGTVSLSTSSNWSTFRGAVPGYWSAIGASPYVDGDDSHNVDGYMKQYANAANQAYTFPVGNGTDIRELTLGGTRLASSVVGTAWIVGDPSGNLDPTAPNAGTHNITSVGTDIVAVSPVGQWDWQDISNDAAGMTVTVSIPDMASFALADELRLVGWDGTEWVDLSGGPMASGVVENSTLSGTMITGISAIAIGMGEPFETEPDANVTLVNVPVDGNVNTNDDVPVGTTYGTPLPDAGNPAGGTISMNPDGTYTFTGTTPGEYNYDVPVCPPGVTVNCPTESLTITVNDPTDMTEPPTANPDVATTLQNTPVTTNVLSNDACNNGPSCTLSNPTIVSGPSNGTIGVDPSGTLTYTPATDFVGTDTVYYSVCDNQTPTAMCDTEVVVYTVLPTGSPNSTEGNDDYVATSGTTPASGNVLDNDSDPEGHSQTVTPQTVTTPEGTLVLNTNGTYTFTPVAGASGTVSTVYTVCDNGSPAACDSATLTILIENEPFETEPDANVTLVNVPVDGNVNTNDDVPVGTTYGTPLADAGNPAGGTISMNPDGTYTFTGTTPGEYNYDVPVCPPGVTVNCPTESLTITVNDPTDMTEPPTANPDVATTLQNTPVTTNVLSNDACNNGPSCTLSNPTIVSGPSNGTIGVDPSGTLTYTPATDFVGTDTVYYSVCDNQTPTAMCDTEVVVYTVLPTGSPNSTEGNDDYVATSGTTPASGNVLDNDSDPEGHSQTVTPQTVTTPEGTLVLNTNGTYTFTPVAGASGTVSTVYTVCDNGSPAACDSATLTILIENEPFETEPDANVTLVNVPVDGNVNTNDDVPVGTTYGTPLADAGNPAGGTISMNPDGTYTFTGTTPGEYNYDVPVCPPGVTVNCPTELLTITVNDPMDSTASPTANPDVATTIEDTPVTIDVTSNDDCNGTSHCVLSNPTIAGGPSNGTVVVDPSGTLTYTPSPGFVGIDTVYYSVCDNQSPTAMCDTEIVILTILPIGTPNSTEGNDDYVYTDDLTGPATGNVLDNDTDPEGDTQMVTPQNITTPEGTFVLLANGGYTFTPANGFTGPIDFVYTVCDNGTPQACDSATIHILVNSLQAPLPLNLLSFSANEVNCQSHLRWSTIEERDTKNFVLQRRVSGSANYENITSLNAKGNSHTQSDYSYVDLSVKNNSYEYRLQMFDQDGRYTYSEVRTLKINCDQQGPVVKVFPNPMGQTLHISAYELDLNEGEPVSIAIYSSVGQIVYKTKLLSEGGKLNYNLDISSWSKGHYLIRLTGYEGNFGQTVKVTKK